MKLKQKQLDRTQRAKNPPDLATTLDALKQGEHEKMSSTVFYGLSGMTTNDLERFGPVWEMLSPEFRRRVVRRLADVVEANVELDYRILGLFSLTDSDPGVREAAIDLLFDDLSPGLLDQLIEMAQWDESTAVRAAAMSALGRYILAGELGNLPESETSRAQDIAVSLLTNDAEDVDVRRRALEAISNCGHEIVDEAISEAYQSDDPRMRVSSLYAMGRSYDERWNPVVVRELESPDPEMRYEAARAAGELETRDAVPSLVKMAFGTDAEIQEAAIWSLGEIGGRDSMRALEAVARKAEEAGDDDLLEVIEEAIANAALVGEFDRADLDD